MMIMTIIMTTMTTEEEDQNRKRKKRELKREGAYQEDALVMYDRVISRQ